MHSAQKYPFLELPSATPRPEHTLVRKISDYFWPTNLTSNSGVTRLRVQTILKGKTKETSQVSDDG